MFTKTQEALEALGAAITTKEIKQEPRLWQETMTFFDETRDSLDSFLKRVCNSANRNNVHVIFTGAGTSEYIGNTICPYLKKVGIGSAISLRALLQPIWLRRQIIILLRKRRYY